MNPSLKIAALALAGICGMAAAQCAELPRPDDQGQELLMNPPGRRLAFVYSPSEAAAEGACRRVFAHGRRFTEALPLDMWNNVPKHPGRVRDAVLIGEGLEKDIVPVDICEKR